MFCMQLVCKLHEGMADHTDLVGSAFTTSISCQPPAHQENQRRNVQHLHVDVDRHPVCADEGSIT